MAALLILSAVAAASIWLVGPPAAVAETAPPDAFSSARAMRHLRELARRPHPTGTADNARVRHYIVEQLSALGFGAETQPAEVVTPQRPAGGPAAAGRVELAVALACAPGVALGAPLPAPAVEVLDDRAGVETRTVRLRLTSPRGAPLVLAHTDASTEVRRARVGGRAVVEHAPGAAEARAPGLRLAYAAPPPEGVELVLELAPASPLRLVVQDISYGLPELSGRANAPRPAGMMPAPSSRTSDTTIVRGTFDLAAGRP